MNISAKSTHEHTPTYWNNIWKRRWKRDKNNTNKSRNGQRTFPFSCSLYYHHYHHHELCTLRLLYRFDHPTSCPSFCRQGNVNRWEAVFFHSFQIILQFLLACTNFADKRRRPLGRYSSLVDYKPRSLVFCVICATTGLFSTFNLTPISEFIWWCNLLKPNNDPKTTFARFLTSNYTASRTKK
jgi:hypothetical protein